MAGLLAPALAGAPASFAQQSAEPPQAPSWLMAHVGEGKGQIPAVVLYRARALYYAKLRAGKVKNGCYFAMDATRPASWRDRFYIICERNGTFRAISSGYGNGRSIPGANFANGRECAENFSNAQESKLTAGGPYETAEIKTSFKGYYTASGKAVPFLRSFVQFDGEGEAFNARPREIGGHPAEVLHWQCRMKAPQSPYAGSDGYVPYGTLVNYTGGRSNGCTSWAPDEAAKIFATIKDRPTSLYIYPESSDIVAVGRAVRAGKPPSALGLYWNASCLRAIGTPKFWPRETLEPVIERWRRSLPKAAPQPLPICSR